MVRVSVKVKRLLVEEGLITNDQWESARKEGGDILDALLKQGTIEESSLMEVMGRSAGVAPIDLLSVMPDRSAVDSIPEETCRERGILPITKNGNVLTIAVSDPFDVILLDDLKRMSECHVRTVFAHAQMVRAAIDTEFDAGAQQVSDLMAEVNGKDTLEVREERDETQDIEKANTGGDDAPAVKLANLILLRALKEKASDIHVEPCEKHITVRLRIDGTMSRIMTPPKSLLNALNSRLKILAKLDIAERNRPQDGKFQIRFEGRSIDFRLSILPVVGGEKAVIRILDTGSMAFKLESMGYEPQAYKDITHAIEQPYGMMLVTGPTGSGKSTTLYSCVQEVASPEVNVTTVEDPVEYRMDGINQVPVNPKRGMTFAGALRSILRQDPDIVLVGEIRDKETADIAVKAALTGHLVLSTLHTNDAASTITRLVDMGIDPFMVSSSLLCICAQRLGRRLCPQCKLPVDDPPVEKLMDIGFKDADFEGLELFEANLDGCARCSGGYRGRFPVLETLAMSHRLKRMVVEGSPVDAMKEQALEEGMVTLRRVGILNAIRGVTSVEEVLRITLDD
ncbi:MAG: Flp pilus assembly complex ATPase component [bacterium]|nr:Flp pilus assembly complex ATPase component [bacterium]